MMKSDESDDESQLFKTLPGGDQDLCPMAQGIQTVENVRMDAISALGTFFIIIVGCVVADWHFRGVGDRKLRQSLHAEVESYLKPSKRI